MSNRYEHDVPCARYIIKNKMYSYGTRPYSRDDFKYSFDTTPPLFRSLSLPPRSSGEWGSMEPRGEQRVLIDVRLQQPQAERAGGGWAGGAPLRVQSTGSGTVRIGHRSPAWGGCNWSWRWWASEAQRSRLRWWEDPDLVGQWRRRSGGGSARSDQSMSGNHTVSGYELKKDNGRSTCGWMRIVLGIQFNFYSSALLEFAMVKWVGRLFTCHICMQARVLSFEKKYKLNMPNNVKHVRILTRRQHSELSEPEVARDKHTFQDDAFISQSQTSLRALLLEPTIHPLIRPVSTEVLCVFHTH
jgi:hypothetical protein